VKEKGGGENGVRTIDCKKREGFEKERKD